MTINLMIKSSYSDKITYYLRLELKNPQKSLTSLNVGDFFDFYRACGRITPERHDTMASGY